LHNGLVIPLVDTHCHLLPGLDDGPRTWDESLAMCRLAWDDGVRGIAATAHQNEHWPAVTPPVIRAATAELATRLAEQEIPLAIYPVAEVMVAPDTESAYAAGQLLTVADRREYLLVEYPHNTFVDIRDLVTDLMSQQVRPILAHPERQPELVQDEAAAEDLVARGCLLQVSAASLSSRASAEVQHCVRRWARRRLIHLIASDGHSLTRRPPGISAAYRQLAAWEGVAYAERVCSTNGMAVLEGLPLALDNPRPSRKSWWPLAFC
jgi:protein-tyrosine phosphatase